MRRRRLPRSLRATAALLLGALALLGLARPGASGAAGAGSGASGAATTASAGLTAIGGSAGQPNAPAKSPFNPGPGAPSAPFPDSPQLRAEGFSLYQNGCSSCHGMSLEGERGIAPSLRGVGAGPVDFYLSTGRMPLASPQDEPERAMPAYDRSQIDALISYISSFGGPPAPTADPARGDLATGLHEFTLHCAGCHQIVGRGGLTLGAQVPNLQPASSQQIAEAVRMGPYLMPHFDATEIDQRQLDSIAKYVIWTRRPADAGGWGLNNIGPIPEGIVAWFIGLLALVLVARLIGERTT